MRELISIRRHPWLGYGFEGFWVGMKGGSAAVLQSVGFFAIQAHNGFLQLSLDLGLLGLVTFVTGYLVLCASARWQIARRVPGPASYWPCAFLCLLLLYNFDESAILAQNSIFWLLYTSTAVNVAAYVR